MFFFFKQALAFSHGGSDTHTWKGGWRQPMELIHRLKLRNKAKGRRDWERGQKKKKRRAVKTAQRTQRTGVVELEKLQYTWHPQVAVKSKARVSLPIWSKPTEEAPRLTLVERRLLSLQPDLHNVQRCDCKQMHRIGIGWAVLIILSASFKSMNCNATQFNSTTNFTFQNDCTVESIPL